jgi:hypothetical protein
VKAQPTAGYSGTPLAKKLGIKPGMTVCAVDAVWSGLKLVIRKELRGAAPGEGTKSTPRASKR